MRKYEVSINNKQYSVVVKKYTKQNAELEINGKPYLVNLDEPIAAPPSMGIPVQPIQPVPQPQAQPVAAAPTPTPATAASTAPVGAEVIKAPIPGSILEVLVKVGDTVTDGQTVFKMEAMKMENDINTTSGGTVSSISVSVGDAVNQGQELLVIE